MQSPITPFVKDTILLLAAKRTMWRKEGNAVDTLVIGSSHGDFGFNPAFYPKSFNLCFRSQDLKHSFHLFEKLTGTHSNIKDVVLFYSVFSPGHFMEKSPSEKFISPPMSEVFRLNFDYDDESLQSIANFIKGELDEISVEIDGVRGFFPDSAKGFMPESYTVEKRASDHLKRNRSTDANVYLTKLLDLAAKQKQRVCIVIPPVRSDYKRAIGVESKELYRPLFELIGSRSQDDAVEVLNCFDDPQFLDGYFGDYDHLHPNGDGVGLLTKLVKQKMGRSSPTVYSNSISMSASAFTFSGNPLASSPLGGGAAYIPSFKK